MYYNSGVVCSCKFRRRRIGSSSCFLHPGATPATSECKTTTTAQRQARAFVKAEKNIVNFKTHQAIHDVVIRDRWKEAVAYRHCKNCIKCI
jgi:hypothetical protein